MKNKSKFQKGIYWNIYTTLQVLYYVLLENIEMHRSNAFAIVVEFTDISTFILAAF